MPVYKEYNNLKHKLTKPHECAVTSEDSQQMFPVICPSTASRFKAWADIPECLFKELW